MPFTIKTTFAFEGIGQGFSETFYWAKDDDNLANAEDLVTPLAQKRAKLLANGYILAVVRNAVVKNNAGDKVKRITDIFEPRLAGVTAWNPATPNMCLMCVWQTFDNKYSKKLYMRGIPAGIGDLGKTPDFSFGTFGSNFNAWRSAMIAFKAGWLATTPTQTAIINSYTVGAQNGIVTFTLNGAGLVWPVPVGFQTSVHISLPGKSPLDGSVLVVPTDATHCYTAKPYGVAPFVVGQLGVMQIRTPDLKTLGSAVTNGPTGAIHPQRILSHKTGAPTYASRGRAAARPRW